MIEQFRAVCHLVLMHSTDYHPNRGLHNWLIYRKIAAYLDAHADRITGTVYDLGCGDSLLRTGINDRADEIYLIRKPRANG